MLTTKNELTILYEGKEKQISIGSTIKQLEQEFINKFQTQKNIQYYFYYKINNDIEIILTEESFNDFIDLNITTLFADKKEEKNIRDGDLELNSQKIDSGLDLFIQEFKNEKIKLKKISEKVKNLFNISKEKELEYKLVNNNSKEKKLIDEMNIKINELLEENNKLKEQKNKKNTLKEINVINFQYSGQNIYEKEIESLKNKNNQLKESIKKLKENNEINEKEFIQKIEYLTNENNELSKDNKNIDDEIKSLRFINEKLSEENNKFSVQNERLKKKFDKINKELKEMQNKSSGSSNNSTKIDSTNSKLESNKDIIKPERRNKKLDTINKLYQEFKDKNLIKLINNNSGNSSNNSFNNLDSSINESLNLNSSQVFNKDNVLQEEEKKKNKIIKRFQEKLAKLKGNK